MKINDNEWQSLKGEEQQPGHMISNVVEPW